MYKTPQDKLCNESIGCMCCVSRMLSRYSFYLRPDPVPIPAKK